MANSVGDILEKIFFLFLGLYLGYISANKLNQKQNQRKEDWELLVNLKQQVKSTAKEGISYYSQGVINEEQAILIQRMVKNTASDFHQFLSAIDASGVNNGPLIRFRQALTKNLEKVSNISEQLEQIKDEIIDTEIKLAEAAWSKYMDKHRK